MDNHMLKQNVSSGDLNNEYYNRIHSIIDNINDVIFLTEDNEVGTRFDQTISLNFIYRIPVTKR